VQNRTDRRPWIPLAVIVCILLHPNFGAAKTDPESNRIRLLLIGECTLYQPYFVTLFPADPKIDLVTVITAGDHASPKETARYLRISMPRTRERFLSDVDALELFDFVPWVLEDYHIQWFHDAVKDYGAGMALVEMGWYSFYGLPYTSNDPEAWMKTVLYEAYPVDLVLYQQNSGSAYLEIAQGTPW